MIVNFEAPQPRQYTTLDGGTHISYSSFDRGTAEIVLFWGHYGEYRSGLFPTTPLKDLPVVETWDADEARENGTLMPEWVTRENLGGEYDTLIGGSTGPPHPESAWGTAIRITGAVSDLWRLFYMAAMDIDPQYDPADYTPGGDDDTYDYYPSAFDALAAFASDLDECDRRLVATGWEPKKFNAHRRMCEVVANLYDAKGPFEGWEFEGHVEPYLAQAMMMRRGSPQAVPQ